jgi:hypothetical protein
MLEELRRLTSTEPYKSYGGMRMKEILITPWNTPDAKFVFEIWIDENEEAAPEIWEVICNRLAQTNGIPKAIIPTTELKLFDDHPVLWHLDDQIFFSVISKSCEIPALIGELFIEHTRACGNWVDFHGLYAGLEEILETLGENQLAIPARLKAACFKVLDKYGVEYRINSLQTKEKDYHVLFFSTSDIWPDEENFSQGYIIAKQFSGRRLM